MAQIKRRPGTRYAALVPNDKGAVRAVDAGVDDIHTVLLGEREPQPRQREHDHRRVARASSARRRRSPGAAGKPVYAGISCSFGCPFEGDVPVAQLERVVERLVGFGARGHRPRRHHRHGESRAGRARARAPDAPLPRRRVDDPHARHARDGHPEHPRRDGAGRDALRRVHRRPRRLSVRARRLRQRLHGGPRPLPARHGRGDGHRSRTRSSRPPGASRRSSAARCPARSSKAGPWNRRYPVPDGVHRQSCPLVMTQDRRADAARDGPRRRRLASIPVIGKEKGRLLRRLIDEAPAAGAASRSAACSGTRRSCSPARCHGARGSCASRRTRSSPRSCRTTSIARGAQEAACGWWRAMRCACCRSCAAPSTSCCSTRRRTTTSTICARWSRGWSRARSSSRTTPASSGAR